MGNPDTGGQKSHQTQKTVSWLGHGDWRLAHREVLGEAPKTSPKRRRRAWLAASHGRETIPSLGYTTAETCLDQEPTSKTWLYVMPRVR